MAEMCYSRLCIVRSEVKPVGVVCNRRLSLKGLIYFISGLVKFVVCRKRSLTASRRHDNAMLFYSVYVRLTSTRALRTRLYRVSIICKTTCDHLLS
jgi:hypothetical protein